MQATNFNFKKCQDLVFVYRGVCCYMTTVVFWLGKNDFCDGNIASFESLFPVEVRSK